MKKSIQYGLIIVPAVMSVSPLMARPLGMDVSSYQGSINWGEVATNGITFAFTKATEGNFYQDSYYAAHMKNGKAAGILMGAYHFAHPEADTAATEATYFWNFAKGSIKADGKTLMPMVDFEIFQGHDGTSTYTAWFNNWSSDVIADGQTAGVTLRPVIFVSAGAGACDLTTSITLGAFIGNYNGESPQSGNPWSCCQSCNAWAPNTSNAWIFWSYGTGSVPGVSGDVGLDVFNGTLTQLKNTEVVTAYP